MNTKEFQTKLLILFLSDINYFLIMKKIFNSSYFSEPHIKHLYELLLKYHNKYTNNYTIEQFISFVHNDIEINNEIYNKELIEEINKFFNYLRNFIKKNNYQKDLEFVKTEGFKYYEIQYLKQIITNSAKYYQSKNFQKIKELFKSYIELPSNINNNATNILTFDIDNLNNEIYYPIPYKKINYYMNGGLPAKNVGVIVGTSGSGKSWLLIDLLNHYITKGYNVLYITLELSSDYIIKRILSNFFNKNIMRLSIEDLKKYYNKYKETIIKNNYGIPFIIENSPNKIDANDIYTTIENIKLTNKKNIDVILIDYADLMKPINFSNREAEWKKIGNVYKDIIDLAKKLSVPIWTVSQSNRSGYKTSEIDNDNMSGSMEKVFDASFILSFKIIEKQTFIDNENHFIYIVSLKINKNRMGFTGITFYGIADFSIGKIAIFENKDDVYNIISEGLTNDKFKILLKNSYINTNSNNNNNTNEDLDNFIPNEDVPF